MNIKKIILILIIAIFTQTDVFATEICWWQKYGDQTLVNNIKKLYIQNPDLKIATLKTKQMQEVIKMSIANELPQINFDASVIRDLRSSDMRFGQVVRPTYSQTRYLLPLSMSYEIDLYGKNHLQTKEYKKLFEIAEQDEKIAKIYISSNFATGYFNLIKTDKLIENQEKLIKIQEKLVDMQSKKYESGLCGKADVLSETQTLTLFKQELNSLKNTQELIKNQLIAMLGEKELTNIERATLEELNIFYTPEMLDSSAITKRPDFIKSELYVKKSGLDVRVAKRELLPSFTLYGDIGFNAYHLDRMFSNRTFLSGVGVLPSIDIFSGGRKMANLRYKKLEYKKAIEMYNKTVLISLQELNDSLYRIKTAKANYEEAISGNNLEAEKFQLTQNKLKIGASSIYSTLKEERNLYLKENETINEKINYLVMTIELYKALGGQDCTDLL